MNRRRGWTLLELLAVLAIFAVLLAITIPVLRVALARSQASKNLTNMSLTMKDFFVWSNQNNGRMPNAGVPGQGDPSYYGGHTSAAVQRGAYLSIAQSWPRLLCETFGEASPHWQSTYTDPTMGGEFDIDAVRRTNPEWEWTLPSLYTYSATMFMKSTSFPYPGLGFTSYDEIDDYFEYVHQADVAYPSSKGILLHLAPNPGPVRQVAFADGAVSERVWVDARPSGVHPFSADVERRSGAVLYTENGFRGIDF